MCAYVYPLSKLRQRLESTRLLLHSLLHSPLRLANLRVGRPLRFHIDLEWSVGKQEAGMEEIESVHGKADGSSIKNIKVKLVLYDGTTPSIRKFDGSVYRSGRTIPLSGVPVLRQDERGVPNVDKNGDEADAQQHEPCLFINRPAFRLDRSGLGGLSEEPSMLDGLVKDETHEQFRCTGDELRSPLHQWYGQG